MNLKPISGLIFSIFLIHLVWAKSNEATSLKTTSTKTTSMDSRSPASSASACEDLSSLACSGKVRSDGTGDNLSAEKRQLKIHEDVNALTDANIEKFRRLLVQPNWGPVTFRQKVFNSIVMERKRCPGSETLHKSPCSEIFAKELAALVDAENLSAEFKNESDLELRPRYSRPLRDAEILTGSEPYKTISTDHYEALMKLNRNPQREDKIKNELFPAVKKALKAKIDSLPLDVADKEKMWAKLDLMKTVNFDCAGNAKSTLKRLHSQYKSNAEVDCDFQKGKSCRLNICRGITSSVQSEFTLLFVMAHELSHVFDPCALGLTDDKRKSSAPKTIAEMDSLYPLASSLQCLRGSKSVGAQNKISLCKELQTSHKKSAKDRYSDENCANLSAIPKNCNSAETGDFDQIGEATSDLFAAEILAEMISERHPELTAQQWKNGISNALPDVDCHREDQLFGAHPDQIKRINQILLAQPQIRKKMGCDIRSPNKIDCMSAVNSSVEVLPAEKNSPQR